MPQFTVTVPQQGVLTPVDPPWGDLGTSGALTLWIDFDYTTASARLQVWVDRGTPRQYLQAVTASASAPGVDGTGSAQRAVVVLEGRGTSGLSLEVRANGTSEVRIGYEVTNDVDLATDWLNSDQYFSGDEYGQAPADLQDWYALNTFAGGSVGSSDLEHPRYIGVMNTAGEVHENVGEDISTLPTMRHQADSGTATSGSFLNEAELVGYKAQYWSDGAPPPTAHSQVNSEYTAASLSADAATSPTYVANRYVLPLYWHQWTNGLVGTFGRTMEAPEIFNLTRQRLYVDWEGVAPAVTPPHTTDIRYRFDTAYELRTRTNGIAGAGPVVNHPAMSQALQVRDITALSGGLDSLAASWKTPAELVTYPVVESRPTPSTGIGVVADPQWHIIKDGLDLAQPNAASVLFLNSLQADNVEPPWAAIKAAVDAAGGDIIKDVRFNAQPTSFAMAVALTFPRYRIKLFRPAGIYPLDVKPPPLRLRQRDDNLFLNAGRIRNRSSRQTTNRLRSYD